MMIGPDVQSLTEEEIYFNPTYLFVDPSKEYLKLQLIRACACDCDTNQPNRRIGVFSVAKDKQVSFSQGNLQYLPASNVWKFANTQYEYLGNSNKYLSPTYRNWVDLFGWSGEGSNAPFGVSTSTNNTDYAGEFLDWGTNPICGDAPGTWRTMSKDEWEYLIKGRKNAASLRGAAQVNGVNGLIILPDEWECPEGVNFKAGYHNSNGAEYYAAYQQYSKEQWSKLEAAGAIFLPAAGQHDGNGIADIQKGGYYWSATANGDAYAYTLISQSTGAYVTYDNRYDTRSVRLVHDTIVPPPAPCETFEVNGVKFNMMCVEGDKYDYLIGQTEVTRALWKAVMGNLPNNSATTTDAPIDNVTWGECQEFINQLNSLTGMHFRFPTKEEWLYAAKGGPYNKDFLYSGSDNIDEVGWYDGNTPGGVQPVAQLKPNALGIYDMTGNVWEWVLQTSNNAHLYMGGSYAFNATSCLLGNKGTATAPNHKGSIGLRLVLDKHAYVDLGLSVMWATTNVGAETPEQYGDYYAWGETEPKNNYDWSTYKWCDGTKNNMTKYNSTDGLITLLPEDDAAHVNWGGEWRMPKDAEWTELREHCTWQWTTQNGVDGYLVTGPNGNSIFLPDAGYRITTDHSVGNAYYWTHDLSTAELMKAKGIYFSQHTKGKDKYRRRCGFSVRPVVPIPDDGKVTVTINATPSQAIIHLHSTGYTAEGNTIVVEKGKDVVYQVTNVANRYLSQGDSLQKLTSDTTLNITLAPFSEGNWVQIDNSTMQCVSKHFVHKNGKLSSETTGWLYYVLPVLPGEEYRISTIAGQDVAAWMAVNTLPDIDSNTPASIVSYSPNKGVAVYIAEEMRVPAGATHLIIHARDNKQLILEKNVHEYIDLGLSVLWATTNVGANTPEEYGEYYAWGETEPKDNFTWANYKWCDGTVNNITKYNNIDSLITLLPEDDAAHVNWGGEWRMPTFEEQRELREYCTWTWETINGHTGYRVTGPNGNSIFLPAAGNITNQKLDAVGAMGYQWSSTAKPGIQAHRMHYSHSVIEDYHGGSRACGASVRPVIPTGREPLPAPCQTITVNGVTFNMMCVGGEMYDYLIGQTEVTQGLWKTVMGYNNCLFQGDDLPVESISWNECQTFIQKLNALTGMHFRLPTEAEWQFAAQGGKQSRGYTYAGSNTIDSVAWYSGNSHESTHKVASLMPNELGIYDMSGNVWEWCQDYYNADKTEHVVKSGSFADAATTCRIKARTGRRSDYQSYIGLRLVLDTHQYVDLGLSVLWATTNVGATEPEEYGDYYAWGETETKDYYGWSTYKWCNATDTSLTKYCTNAKYGADGFTDGLTTLLPEDDAAHVHWGTMWRMATKSEFRELIDNCNWETTTLNGVKGYRVTSTIPGYTDRSIFLPLAGYHNHDLGSSNIGTSARYWSSTCLNSSASDLYMAKIEGNTRRIGMSIRPVLPTDRTIKTPTTEPAKRIGVFSVAKGKHVSFSQGNLMYLKLKDKWQFAPNQLYYTGERHLQNDQIADTVMYFGWSAKDSKAPWGISTSTSLNYYKGEFLDWGTNTIQGDKPNTWRSMTNEEVVYLFEGRKNAAQLIGFAEVDGIKGMIILPDDCQLPEDLSFTPFDGTTVNQYTLEQWQQMENVGAVIIPAAGYVNNKLSPKMREVGEASFLPYSVLIDSIHQQYSYLRHDKMLQRWPGNNTGNLFYAFPRRLVHDTVIPEYVDMGLSVKWANYNLGASTPSGVGEYYAWGETLPKESYTIANYQWSKGNANTFTKYCTIDSMGYNGYTDTLTTLQAQDDAAQMQKGGHWRMPTDAEWEELRKNCTWTKAEQGGQAGYIATSKINGNRIFIPVAGFRSGDNIVLEYIGGYWSSSLNQTKQSCAYGLYINIDEDRVGKYSNSSRHNGFLIRPVYDENYHAYIDLGLSVYWATTNISATAPEEYGDYFAWGETEPKENFAWENYKWCDGTRSTITKYNATDGLTTLLPEDDAAYVNWGREWRMPTNDELTELRTLCTWEAETINGVKGAKVTGPNGNSIFIPLGGSYNTFDDQLNSVGTHGWLYSSAKASADQQAQEIGISSSGGAQTSCSRCLGLNIRPVRQNKTYYYGFTDEQFASATSTWNPPGMGWAIIDQSPIQGKVLYGIRMKVAKAGSFNLYKVTTLAETSESNMQFLTTVTTSTTGLQDIDFEAPFYLAANEYLVVSRPSDASTTTLVGNHMTSNNMLQPFYRQVGTSTVSQANISSLMIDFY